MPYVLLFVVVALACGGYYEYLSLEGQISDEERQVYALKTKTDEALANEKILTNQNAELISRLAALRLTLADLNQQPGGGKPGSKATAPTDTPATPPAAPKVPPPSNQLGTIVDLDGKNHADCKLLKVQNDGIVVSDSDGIAKLAFGILPKDLQTRFGYDPAHGNLTDDQVQALEDLRAAAPSDGT